VKKSIAKKSFKYLLLVFTVFFSAVLMALAFPWNNYEWLGWIAISFFLVSLCGRNPILGYFLSFFWTIVFYVTLGPWLFNISGYSLLHHSILAFYLGFVWGPFGLVFCIIAKRWGAAPALLAAPFLWVAFEYLRSNLGFFAFPWGLIAHSQYQNQSIIQFASLIGTYGISFLLAIVNSAIAVLALYIMGAHRKLAPLLPLSVSKRWMLSLVVPAVLFTVSALVFGIITLSTMAPGPQIRVSVVQGNIEQKKKWDRRYARYIMQTYAELTQEVARNGPELIIWPEAATPHSIDGSRRLQMTVNQIAEKSSAHLLLGSSSYQKFEAGRAKKVGYKNSAFLIHPDGSNMNQRYDKMVLLPFGEYLPYKDKIPWSAINIPDLGSFLPGEEYTIFKGTSCRFGVAICWESVFPEHVRQLVKKEAQFIVNIGNEAWFGKTAAPYQMLSMNVFRAVENRVFVIRCTNTGISCFIDPYGRIINSVRDDTGQNLFVKGVLTENVTLMNSETFFTRHGDLLPWICIFCLAVFFLAALLKKSRLQINKN